MTVGHDGNCILFSVQELEIEVLLEEGASFGEVVYTEIEVIELHWVLLKLEVHSDGAFVACSVSSQALDLGKLADALHLRLSWVQAQLRRTVTPVAMRAIGLPTDPAFSDASSITHR